MSKFQRGLIISEVLKRTPDEDSKDKMLGAHRFNLTPPVWDWRNVMGKNYVTDVQDQGQCGCYDDKTEVSCRDGWKLFKNIDINDEILCYDPATEELRYEHPSHLFEYDYDGKMIQIKGSSIDLLVTPNHNMLVSKWDESKRTVSDKEEFIRADSLGWYVNIPCTGHWNGEPKLLHTVKGCEIGPYGDHSNNNVSYKFREGFDVPMDDWVSFLGAYLAEGCTTPQRSYSIEVAAVKDREVTAFDNILSKIPIHSKYNGKDRYIMNDKRLSIELALFEHAPEKYVPDYIKNLPPEQILMFIRGFGLGDGQWIEKNQNFRLYTSSKKLVDDLQELVLKTGKWAKISVRGPRLSTTKDGRMINGNYPEYSLYIADRKHFCVERKRHISEVKYTGKVYCAEVPTHAMVVRRNGKPIISGNSCVGFGSTATLETTLMAANKLPQMDDIKRSELDLFVNIGTCSEGATLEAANTWLVSHGVCAERCYPYNGKKQVCADTTRIKILSATRITSDAAAKAWICTYGPIQGAMDVPLSLENWTGGVYKNTNNSPNMGGHCVSIIGYDDAQGCWIVKNSWGPNWCEKGYFRIAYGQCNIFRGYAGYGYTVNNTPAPEPTPVPVETGDIVTPKAGIISIQPCIKGSSSLSWSLNGINKGQIKSMPNGYTNLGTFAQGKGLTFGLITSSGKKSHNVTVIPVVVGQIWMLLMGTTTNNTVSFLVKLE